MSFFVKTEETDCNKKLILNQVRKLSSSLNTLNTNFQSLNMKLQSTSLSLTHQNITHVMIKQMRIKECKTLEVMLNEDVEGQMRTSRDVCTQASMINDQT